MSLPVSLLLSLPEALTLDISLVYIPFALLGPAVLLVLDWPSLVPSSPSLLAQSEALERSPLSLSLFCFLRTALSEGSMTRTFLLGGPSSEDEDEGLSSLLVQDALLSVLRFLGVEEASFSDVLEAPLSLGLFLNLSSLLPEVLISDSSSFLPPSCATSI